MRFGYWIGNGHTWDDILAAGIRAEETSWDGLWFADHFMPFQGDVGGPIHEAWSVLSGLAVATDRVRLGPLVAGNTYRHPAVLAKQAVAADHISHGRVVLGIGSGWQENEHVAYGLEFGTFTDRFERLEESLQIIRSLRDNDRTTFAGQHYQLDDAPLEPKPIGKLPILIGGGGEKKTLRMVADYADEWNVWSTPEIMAQKAAVLDAHCTKIDRDPASIQRSAVALLFLCDTAQKSASMRENPMPRPSLIGTVSELRDQIAAFADAGVDEVIIPDFTLGQGAALNEILDQFITGRGRLPVAGQRHASLRRYRACVRLPHEPRRLVARRSHPNQVSARGHL
ncbi:MAG: LLM class F420-dependent oxidoreductase [Acidimicrobiales bacterium]